MNIYQNTFQTATNQTIDFQDFENNVLLIVNTASQCGWTWQYQELENLYQKYKSKGLVVIAFPSNDFGNQEPGTDDQIAEFCSSKYNISFPISTKTNVVSENQNPLFADLINITGETPHWNFNKYLVGKNAEVVKFFDQNTNPTDELFMEQIESLLS
jgi:glutathione peroxidase